MIEGEGVIFQDRYEQDAKNDVMEDFRKNKKRAKEDRKRIRSKSTTIDDGG